MENRYAISNKENRGRLRKGKEQLERGLCAAHELHEAVNIFCTYRTEKWIPDRTFL